MPGIQQGHYGKADLRYELEHLGIVLAEVQDVSYDFAPQIMPGGAGIGSLKNNYFKQHDAPKGTGKIARNELQRSDYGRVFLDLVAGSQFVIQENIATAAASYTPSLNTVMVTVLEIRLNTSLAVLREVVDYTINYLTGVVTFTAVLPEAATIRYLTSSRRGKQFIVNGGFEDALGTTWSPFATATIARNSTGANVAAESWALAVTPTAVSDGVQYNIPIVLQPGRQYRFSFRAKAAAAEVLTASYYNGTVDVLMAPASVTLTTTYTLYEFTFTATVAAVPNIKIKDTKAGPAIFYIDEVKLIDDLQALGTNPSLGINPMDAGLTVPFMFNIIERRTMDGVVTARLQKCALTKYGAKSGKEFMEDVEFEFLDYITE